jgi:hypothetical protein
MEAWLIIENFLDGDGYRAFELYENIAYKNKYEAKNRADQIISEDHKFPGFSYMIADENTNFGGQPMLFADGFWADPSTMQQLGDVKEYKHCLTLREITIC